MVMISVEPTNMYNESKQVFQKADYTDGRFDDLVICTDEDMLVKTVYYSVWKHQNVYTA